MASRKKAAAEPEMPSVDARGQISIELDGTWYVLRPSEEAIATAEEELGISLEQMVALNEYARLNLNQVAVIVTHMMRAYGKANPEASADYKGAKVDTVRKLIFEAGVPRARARLAPLLAGAMTGGYTAEGELKATS